MYEQMLFLLKKDCMC